MDVHHRSKATDDHLANIFANGLASMQGITVNPGELGNELLGKMGSAFRRWCRLVKKIEIPPCTWNLHWIGRGGKWQKELPGVRQQRESRPYKTHSLLFAWSRQRDLQQMWLPLNPLLAFFWNDMLQQKWGNRCERWETLFFFWLPSGNSTSESPKVSSALFDLLQFGVCVSSSLLLIAQHFDWGMSYGNKQ